jgi:hypothetical protein
MKTYTETKDKQKFDWRSFLEERIKEQPKGVTSVDNMTSKDIIKMRNKFKGEIKMAGDWVTCACGNQCSILDRDGDGEPVDDKLAELGSDFYYFVNDLDWKEAKTILKEIEKRSAKLIQEKIQTSKKILTHLGYKVVEPSLKKVNNK